MWIIVQQDTEDDYVNILMDEEGSALKFKDKISAPFKTPVIYITQLLGLAMGIDPYRLGVQKTPVPNGLPPFTPVDPIFTKLIDKINL